MIYVRRFVVPGVQVSTQGNQSCLIKSDASLNLFRPGTTTQCFSSQTEACCRCLTVQHISACLHSCRTCMTKLYYFLRLIIPPLRRAGLVPAHDLGNLSYALERVRGKGAKKWCGRRQ